MQLEAGIVRQIGKWDGLLSPFGRTTKPSHIDSFLGF